LLHTTRHTTLPLLSSEKCMQTPILLRIAFHDAGTWISSEQVGGANGSIAFELQGPPNNTVVRRFGWPFVQQVPPSCAVLHCPAQ
jgi:catalase (peroxidase I)